MPLNPDAMLALQFDPVEQTLTPEACILYGLSIGIGRLQNAEDWRCHIAGKDVIPFPTMTATVCREGPWGHWPGTGITPERCVHVGQSIELHRPFSPRTTIVAEQRIVGIEDFGAQKGALIRQEKRLYDKATGDLLATLVWSVLARNDRGFGGRRQTAPPAPEITAPALQRPLALPTDCALLYRLTGDDNPIHTDPDLARAAGFPAPLLQGLCLLGMATATLLHAAGKTAANLRAIDVRFARPSYPGETVQLKMGKGNPASFAAEAQSGQALIGTFRLG